MCACKYVLGMHAVMHVCIGRKERRVGRYLQIIETVWVVDGHIRTHSHVKHAQQSAYFIIAVVCAQRAYMYCVKHAQ